MLDNDTNLEELNDDPSLPRPVDRSPSLGRILGTQTGETEHSDVMGGWAGTDDATSTAPSDLTREERDREIPLQQQELGDITGRAAGGESLGIEEPISDLEGSPVENSRNWVDSPTEEEIERSQLD